MFKPEGVYVAMLTAFNDEGTINEAEIRRIVDFQIERGVDGLFPISSVGESVHLSTPEKMRLMEIVVDQAGGRVPVTPGVAATEPRLSIKLAAKAEELGCAAVVAHPPYFYTLAQESIAEYFEVVADNIGLPLILYNIPLFSTPISYEVVKQLAKRPNVVAMKDSSGSMVDFMHFLDETRSAGQDLNLLVGREETLLASLSVGGKGCMSATSGILPELMVGIYRAWQAGDLALANKLQSSILGIVRAMFALPFPLGFKVAMETRGFAMGPPIQPLSATQQSDYSKIKTRIKKIMAPLLADLEK